MVQPAGELLDEIFGMAGEKKFILGQDERGRIDIFFYCAQKDRVYHIKVEEIRPRLKGAFFGHDITGFGDEVPDCEKLIEQINEYGFGVSTGEKLAEKIKKYQDNEKEGREQNEPCPLPTGTISVEGSTDAFYAGFHNASETLEQARNMVPKKIGGALSAELDAHLHRRKLGTGDYIW